VFLRFLAIQKVLASGGMEVTRKDAKLIGVPYARIVNGTPRQLLVQAAALLVAAIEREDRIEARLAASTALHAKKYGKKAKR
jgi:hypothetical protein